MSRRESGWGWDISLWSDLRGGLEGRTGNCGWLSFVDALTSGRQWERADEPRRELLADEVDEKHVRVRAVIAERAHAVDDADAA